MYQDYLDPDVAYLLGTIVSRGEFITQGESHRLVIHFPKGHFIAEGEGLRFDTSREIRLGIERIRERLLELLAADIRTYDAGENLDLVITSPRYTMAWRNLNMLLEGKTSFPYFKVPPVLFDPATTYEAKAEFIRGFGDVGGNVRPANRDQMGRHRVRFDVLNYPSNWEVPVQLCTLLQEHLGIPVSVIAWGHPNFGREWREHQINTYAEDLSQVGFSFDFKQAALDSLAEANLRKFPSHKTKLCPGRRKGKSTKPLHSLENDTARLDTRLTGKHFDHYWEICKALGCQREPSSGEQLGFPLEG